jgi:uncharacterized caspase-like protein
MRICFVALVVLLAFVLPAAAGKRIALVIGNSDYAHVSDLKNPKFDADLMTKTLEAVGFEVMRADNLDQRAMKQALVDFGRKLKQGAEASMFYYAGHGIELNGVNFLVPVDADTRSSDEADIQNVSVNSVLALTENSGVPLNIIVLDACRNNPFRSMRAASSGGLAAVTAPRGTYVAYATSPGSVAADGDGDNSPFTLALAQSVKVPGLTLEGVLKRTRQEVQTVTDGKQLPYDSSAITGDFFFIPAVAVAPLVEPPPPPAPVLQPDVAQAAFAAAGDDPALLKVVADSFPGTVWAALASEKLKRLQLPTPETPQVEIVTPETVQPLKQQAPVAQPALPKWNREAAEPQRKEKSSNSPLGKKPKPQVQMPVRTTVVKPQKPLQKKAVTRAPSRAANYPSCKNIGRVKPGTLCTTGDGRVCRTGHGLTEDVQQGWRRPLEGCRQM